MSEPTLSSADLVSAAMADSGETTATPPPVDNSAPVAENTGGHPAWQEVLSVVPEVLHDKVRPTLEKWDKGVQSKLEEYTRTYEPYKPIVEAGSSIEELQAGLQLMQLLNADPKKFYESMGTHYGYANGTSGQGDTSSADTIDLAEFSQDDITKHPEFKKLAEGQQQVLEAMQAQQAQQQQREAEQWLTSRQAQITERLGIDPDWDYILNKALTISQRTNNYDKALDQAADDYKKLVEGMRAPVATLNAPPVIAPTGSVPASGSDVKTIAKDDSTRKNLLAQALAQALADNKG